MTTIFLRSDTTLLFFLLFALVQLLFEGSFHFIGKPVDSDDGCMKKVHAGDTARPDRCWYVVVHTASRPAVSCENES